jgi:3-methyl-2-oxobutanoate hydroxymethyltransferase
MNQTSADGAAVTMRDLRRWAREDRKFAMLTCYDATTARWLYRGGLRVMMVGDTAGQFILGYDNTIHASLELMCLLTAAVKRGAPGAFVMGDLPFGSYHADDAEAVRNACRLMTDGQADAVKLEVDERFVETVAKIARAGVPTVAHLGWRPQRLQQTGVPQIAGKTAAAAEELVELACRMQSAGASMLLLEATAAEAARRVVEAVQIPVLGCGAGAACHGHVVVLQDLLGMSDWQPSFAAPMASVGQHIADAAKAWTEAIATGAYPAEGRSYHMGQ